MFYKFAARDKTPYLASTKFHYILAKKKTMLFVIGHASL